MSNRICGVIRTNYALAKPAGQLQSLTSILTGSLPAGGFASPYYEQWEIVNAYPNPRPTCWDIYLVGTKGGFNQPFFKASSPQTRTEQASRSSPIMIIGSSIYQKSSV